ncbi:MAG: molybdate ABC transporter substrate-binding protein [Polaromonas sp.]
MKLPVLNRVLAALALATVAGAALAGEVTVSAASSLTNAFREIAQNYQARYPDAKVELNFGASGALLQQIAKGAPVDVFASADQETMNQAQKQGLVAASERHEFARNHLVLITPMDSKLVIKQLPDLNQPAIVRVAIGNPASVPVGRYTRQALEAAQLWTAMQAKAISTQNVRQSLDYVARGEVDAGFVYATDAALMKDKVKVVMQVPLETPILYPMARISSSTHTAEAQRFMDYLRSPAAQTVLANHGFSKP